MRSTPRRSGSPLTALDVRRGCPLVAPLLRPPNTRPLPGNALPNSPHGGLGPGKLQPGVGGRGCERGEGPHTVPRHRPCRAPPPFRLWPGAARFLDGTRGARDSFCREMLLATTGVLGCPGPAPRYRGTRVKRNSHNPPAGRVRCGVVPGGFCRGAVAAGLRRDAIHGKAGPIPPIRFDAEGRGLAWEGARLPIGGQGRLVARLPRCPQDRCGFRDRRCGQVSGFHLAPFPPGCFRCRAAFVLKI